MKEMMMEHPNHNLASLFAQLGLDNSDAAIKAFISTHKVAADIAVEKAPFWLPAQAAFLTEQLKADADWSEVIDELSVLLR